MVRVGCAKSVAVCGKRILVNVVYCVVFHKDGIVTAVVGIANHCLYVLFRAVIVSFVVAFEGAVHHIAVDVDWPLPVIHLRHVDGQQRYAVIIHDFDIVFGEDIPVYLIAVQCVKDVLLQFVWIIDTGNFKSFIWVGFFHMLGYTKQDNSSDGVCEG